MFNKARLKLTGWYLLIIMVISIAFSLGIYRVLTNELDRVERVQRGRLGFVPQRRVIDQEVIQETKDRLIAILSLINLAILVGSAGAGYFLAGRTLKPIKEMMDEQGRFITDASHELRTPLTSLKSEIEVNLRDKNLNLKDAKKILESNLEEVNNLQYLSDNLIKLTQHQAGNGSMVEVDLLEITNEAQRKVSNLAKRRNIVIKNGIKNQSIKGDRQSLVELFVILLDNAIKYSPKGKAILISSKMIDTNIEINIKDEGIGISQKDLPHLFDRFYRADKSRTKISTPGYGLGLSIAKQIVEKHGGILKVESKIDKGTTFSILI